MTNSSTSSSFDTTLLDIVQPSMVVLMCREAESQCSGHGFCVSGRCVCTDFFTGSTCEHTYEEVLGVSWTIFTVGFIVLYTVLAAVALVQLIRSALLGGLHVFNYWRLLHVFVLLQGVVQMFDLGLIPSDASDDAVPPWLRRLLQGLSVYIIVAIICIILLFWCTTYQRTFSHEPHPRLRRIKFGFKLLMAVFFVVELTCRLVYDMVPQQGIVFAVHAVFVGACCAVTAGGFLIFGRRAYARMMDTASTAIFRKRFEQIQFLTVTASTLLLLAVLSLIVFGALAMSVTGFLEQPTFYMLQQSVYRFIQAMYCGFILWALRLPPEIESRAGERQLCFVCVGVLFVHQPGFFCQFMRQSSDDSSIASLNGAANWRHHLHGAPPGSRRVVTLADQARRRCRRLWPRQRRRALWRRTGVVDAPVDDDERHVERNDFQ
jgi:hypothetical protein